MAATNCNTNYPRCKVKNRWHCIDALSQNAAVTVLLSLLPIRAANASVMHNSNRITVWLPYLQHHKSLTLRWPSFWCIVHSTSAAIDNSFYHDLNLLVFILRDWDLALWRSQAQWNSSTVHTHTPKIDVSCQMLHWACYTSIHQPIFTSYCSQFAHNISLTKTLGQDT